MENWFVRVWADPHHGYMPSLIEKYILNEHGKPELWGRTRIQEFVAIGDDAWAPVRATFELIGRVGLNTGKGYIGTSLLVDIKSRPGIQFNPANFFPRLA
jgi:hypothetical protein